MTVDAVQLKVKTNHAHVQALEDIVPALFTS